METLITLPPRRIPPRKTVIVTYLIQVTCVLCNMVAQLQLPQTQGDGTIVHKQYGQKGS